MDKDANSKTHIVITVIAVLIIYILSYGPACALMVKYRVSGLAASGIEYFYAPLSFFCERLGMDEFMRSYLFWWGRIFGVSMHAWYR